MPNITVESTVERILALQIPSVKVNQSFPPASVSTAQLPLLYVRDMSISLDELTMTFSGGSSVVSGEIVILVEASRQNTQEELYKKTRKIMDELYQALVESPSLRLLDFTIKEDFVSAETTSYFIVVAAIRCS